MEEWFRPILQLTIIKWNLASWSQSVSRRLREGRINERIIGNTLPLSPERKEEMQSGFYIQTWFERLSLLFRSFCWAWDFITLFRSGLFSLDWANFFRDEHIALLT